MPAAATGMGALLLLGEAPVRDPPGEEQLELVEGGGGGGAAAVVLPVTVSVTGTRIILL